MIFNSGIIPADMPNKSPLPTGISTTNSNQQRTSRAGGRARRWADDTMKRNYKRIAWAFLVLIAVLCAMIAWKAEDFSITIFERLWTHRLKAIQSPEEMPDLFKRHNAGDFFQKRYSGGEWLAGVSASSCGNGSLPDMLLIREGNGTMHKITNDHFCGRSGIHMAIPDLDSDSYSTAVNAISAKEKQKKIK